MIRIPLLPLLVLYALFLFCILVGVMSIVLVVNWQQSAIFQDTLMGLSVVLIGLTVISGGYIIYLHSNANVEK